ncbi:MAG TPA: serine/threonine-protein kinase [Polyangia bacterium]|nr:serine/threonine-protein kinase [Polyangia bacterium]
MIGETFGNYKVIAALGSGGMGAVYVAEHQRIHRQAAIKVLLPELTGDVEAVRRFLLEARATSGIKHPGIVEILDCDIHHDGRAFIVMELLEGLTLADHLRVTGRLDCDVALSLVGQIANALAAAHDKRIIHRDLKPDNVFLVPVVDGDSPYAVKVLDFGIAKLIAEGSAAGTLTRTGFVVGSPPYMSPEQCTGARAVDQRSDIYSLGCLLFEMICGRPPFLGKGAGELMVAHIAEVPPRPSSLAPLIPAAVERLIDRMMAKAPANRLPSMQDVQTRIAAIRSQRASLLGRLSRDQLTVAALAIPVCAPLPDAADETDRIKPARFRRRAVLLGAMVVGVVAAVVIAGKQARSTRRASAMTGIPAPVPARTRAPPFAGAVIDEFGAASPLPPSLPLSPPSPSPPPPLSPDGDAALQPGKRVSRRRAPAPPPPDDDAPDLMTFGAAEKRERAAAVTTRRR